MTWVSRPLDWLDLPITWAVIFILIVLVVCQHLRPKAPDSAPTTRPEMVTGANIEAR